MDERVAGLCEIGDTAWNVKFTNVTFIVTRTFSRCCQSPLARSRRIVWALFYDGKPSNVDRFTRKRLFTPFRRACGRPIRRRNNEMGRRSSSGFSVRKLWRIMAARLLYRRLQRRQYILAVSADPSRRAAVG